GHRVAQLSNITAPAIRFVVGAYRTGARPEGRDVDHLDASYQRGRLAAVARAAGLEHVGGIRNVTQLSRVRAAPAIQRGIERYRTRVFITTRNRGEGR